MMTRDSMTMTVTYREDSESKSQKSEPSVHKSPSENIDMYIVQPLEPPQKARRLTMGHDGHDGHDSCTSSFVENALCHEEPGPRCRSSYRIYRQCDSMSIWTHASLYVK